MNIGELREYFSYENGVLFRTKSGKRKILPIPAGTLHKRGYIRLEYKSHSYSAHRIIWAICKGEWVCEPLVIDHINGDHLDNRRENLRICTRSQNAMNTIQGRGKSGVHGIAIKNNSYFVYCMSNSKQYHLGYFRDKSDAIDALINGVNKHHGKFSRFLSRGITKEQLMNELVDLRGQ